MLLVSTIYWFLANVFVLTTCFDCQTFFDDPENELREWTIMEKCLFEISFVNLETRTKENILKSIKHIFGGIHAIDAEHFRKVSYILTGLNKSEIRNLTLDNIDIIEAFGTVKNLEGLSGFNKDQLKLLAQKVKNEWYGKTPETYSEYDLLAMGEIVCFLNVEDIAEIHGDAFKEAAHEIGRIEICPMPQLQAFGTLAKKTNAFGSPHRWTKLDVSVLGNIVNGLNEADLMLVDRKALILNRYFREKNKHFLERSQITKPH